jgi:electron transport complex protein RnfC
LPFIETRVTVSGYGIARPQVVKCRIGIPVSDLIVQAGGFVGHVGKIILGSLFEGSAIADINVPVTRTLKSIIVLPWKAARKPRITPCICCGRCVDSCPAELEPLYLEEAIRRDESQLFHQLNGHKCIQCGVCSYTCPSGRPLSEKIRAMVLRLKRGKKH